MTLPTLWTADQNVMAQDEGEDVYLCADDGGAHVDRASVRELRDWLTRWLDR